MGYRTDRKTLRNKDREMDRGIQRKRLESSRIQETEERILK